MLIIAKGIKGAEFFYDATTAHKVSKASAEKICKIVNDYKYKLKADDKHIWHIYEVWDIDSAYDYAQYQSFSIRNGVVSAHYR